MLIVSTHTIVKYDPRAGIQKLTPREMIAELEFSPMLEMAALKFWIH
jgi:hypothetical protein